MSIPVSTRLRSSRLFLGARSKAPFPLCSPQHALEPRTVPPQEQDFALALDELHDIVF